VCQASERHAHAVPPPPPAKTHAHHNHRVTTTHPLHFHPAPRALYLTRHAVANTSKTVVHNALSVRFQLGVQFGGGHVLLAPQSGLGGVGGVGGRVGGNGGQFGSGNPQYGNLLCGPSEQVGAIAVAAVVKM
jgi:hypothetical protein